MARQGDAKKVLRRVARLYADRSLEAGERFSLEKTMEKPQKFHGWSR